MKVIARRTLRRFIDSLAGSADQRAVKTALESWFHEVRRAEWKTPADVVSMYGNASLVGPDRVVFNIKGNSYRLVVAINYARQIVFIKWIGSHSQCDKIDGRKMNYGNQTDQN
ncbi:MAG: type II toxin-antitoxin system HigB family toxin [Candidatus Acidiferrales bacterium]